MVETVAVLIPIVMFIVIGVVLGLYFHFRYRTRSQMQQTVRVALERGQELNAELIDRLGEPRAAPGADLRRGVIAVFIAIGIALAGYLLGEPDAVRPILGASMLPLAVGAAYLILWRFDKSRQER